MTNYLSTHDVRKPTLLIAKVVQRNKEGVKGTKLCTKQNIFLSFHGSVNNMQFNVAIFKPSSAFIMQPTIIIKLHENKFQCVICCYDTSIFCSTILDKIFVYRTFMLAKNGDFQRLFMYNYWKCDLVLQLLLLPELYIIEIQ